MANERIFIVDADPNDRHMLKSHFEAKAHPVAAFSTAIEFFADFEPANPSCLIADLYASDMPGLDLLEEVHRRQWHVPVTFVAAQVDVPTAVRAMRRGAVDICLKPLDLDALVVLVRQTLAVHAHHEQQLQHIAQARQRLASLSPRELELFTLVMEGRSNKEMGARLGISTRTVEQHRAHITTKLGVDRVADMVRLGLLVESARDGHGVPVSE